MLAPAIPPPLAILNRRYELAATPRPSLLGPLRGKQTRSRPGRAVSGRSACGRVRARVCSTLYSSRIPIPRTRWGRPHARWNGFLLGSTEKSRSGGVDAAGRQRV